MLEEFCKRYWGDLAAAGYRSMKFYKQRIRAFVRWLTLKNLSLSQLNSTLIHEFLCFRKARGRRTSVLADDLYALRNFFRYAVKQGLAPNDPTDGVSLAWLHIPGGYPAYQGILRQLINRPAAILSYRLPLFSPDLEMYVKVLADRGYSKGHILKVLQYNLRFHRYLIRQGIKHLTQITPVHLETYQRRWRRYAGAGKRRCSSRHIRNTQGYIEGFLRYAFTRIGRAFRPVAVAPKFHVLSEKLVQDFLNFCKVHKGHRSITQQDQYKELVRLERFLVERGWNKIQEVSLNDLDAYCIERSKNCHVPLKAVGVLRSLFRYLYLRGTISRDLARYIQSPCRFQSNTRPKYLSWDKVQNLLDAIDRRSAGGKRNYAIVVLLACHGLRAREAANLKISDIHWEENAFVLRERKNGATTLLPLSPRARFALQDYIAVRPACPAPEIFLTNYAPFKPLGKHLYAVARRMIYKHLGRLLPQQGAYVLRHSFAKALLDRGAGLPEIGALLGHKSLHGTSAYLQIATEDLREVADTYATLFLKGEQPPCASM